jgi:rhodanese-related sulfurtransferase
MTHRWSTTLAGALAVALASCAKPAPQGAVTQAPPKPAKQKATPAPPKPAGAITAISMEELFALQQSGKLFLLDARPSFFYSLGHIQGAISMPSGGSANHIKLREEEIKTSLAAGKTIVLYCTNAACPDARAVAANFSKAGYPCSVLVGGYESWKESGLPVE